MVQSIAGGEGSVPSREPRPPSDWWSPSWCAATATFSLVRVTISMILRSLGVVPGSATASAQAAAPVLVVLHKVWFVCQDRQGSRAGELSDCQSHVFGKQSVLCLHLSTHHTVQTSVVPQPHPAGLGLVRHRDFSPLYSPLSPPPPRLVLHLSNILKFTS